MLVGRDTNVPLDATEWFLALQHYMKLWDSGGCCIFTEQWAPDQELLMACVRWSRHMPSTTGPALSLCNQSCISSNLNLSLLERWATAFRCPLVQQGGPKRRWQTKDLSVLPCQWHLLSLLQGRNRPHRLHAGIMDTISQLRARQNGMIRQGCIVMMRTTECCPRGGLAFAGSW